jgi:hypothetical protein
MSTSISLAQSGQPTCFDAERDIDAFPAELQASQHWREAWPGAIHLAQGFQRPSPMPIAIYASSAIAISVMVCMSFAPIPRIPRYVLAPVSRSRGFDVRRLYMRHATSLAFKSIKVGQVAKSRRYSSEPHDLRAG